MAHTHLATPIKPGLSFCLQRMVERGFDIRRLVAGTALDETSFTDPETLMTVQQELQVYRNIVGETHSGDIGLELGEEVNLNAVGVLGGLLSNAIDLGHAGYLLRRFELLVSTFIKSELMGELGPGSIIIRYRRNAELGELYRFFVDRDIRGTLGLVVEVFGEQARGFITRIEFGYPRPPDVRRYRQLFDFPVSFGHADTHVTYDYRLAPLANAARSVIAYRIYHYLCRTALNLYFPTTWRERVLTVLSSGNEYPRTAGMAARLNCSERSLRRHLEAEGVSYLDLVDQVRHDRAVYLLTYSRDPVKKIGLQLGYSEPASFVHAFSRWTGVSPMQFRSAPGVRRQDGS